ncbi:Phage protein [plant metagenome]|uniref:Phage protein n=1 Tax=plant metagenome TaxID=1297885 RepID=A0A484QCZ9_9ZZZZ
MTDTVLDEAALAAQQNEAAERTALITQQFGAGQPYDRVRVVTEARFFMAQSAEAMLEAGKRLILVKEHEPHGEFQSIVQDQLGIALRTAQVMMKAAYKYMSPLLASKAQALAPLGRTKLLELMLESDDDLAELAEGGTIAGMTLDDIDTMSSRELKAALREHREEAKAADTLRADKDKRIDALSKEVEKAKRRIHSTPPDEVRAQLLREFSEALHGAEHAIRQTMREGIEVLRAEAQESGGGADHEAVIAAGLAQLQIALDNIRDEFGVAALAAGSAAPSWAGEQ